MKRDDTVKTINSEIKENPEAPTWFYWEMFARMKLDL